MDNVKIVFTDLDSTLTKEKGKVDIINKRIFEKLDSIGIPVVLNTGRSLSYTIPICKQYNASKYLIASNGAEVYNYLTKKVIYRSVISKENLKFLDQLIEKYDLFFVANGIERRYTNKMDEIGFIYSNYLSNLQEDLAQVVIESYDLEKMKLFRKDLMENKELKIGNKTKHIVPEKLLYYDIVNCDVSKGNALKILCDYLSIDSKKSMAIGDSINDIEMLECAGYKVAVANACDELKKIADVVTLSNKQNGVYTILSELYSKKSM